MAKNDKVFDSQPGRREAYIWPRLLVCPLCLWCLWCARVRVRVHRRQVFCIIISSYIFALSRVEVSQYDQGKENQRRRRMIISRRRKQVTF